MVNKKILGMPIAMFVVGLLVMGTATAALVSFLSNEVTASADVGSPIELKFWDGGWVDDITLGSTHGGGTITATLRERNFASNEIDSTLRITISESGVVNECAEIEQLRFREAGNVGWNDVTSFCDVVSNNLQFDVDTLVPAGHDVQYEVEVTFNQYAVGSYTATVQHV